MVPDDERPDPTVKELLSRSSDVVDDATAADLARWFGLPSFQQVAEGEKPAAEDPEMAAVRERRAKAIAAVDPALLASIEQRTEVDPDTLFEFRPSLEVHVDPELALIDFAMIERATAEPREVEIAEDLRDDLKECTPQALLRDLHRSEQVFDKVFELVDVAADQRMDIVAEVEAAMAASWKLPPLGESPVIETCRELDELRAARRRPWTDYLAALPNRRVQE